MFESGNGNDYLITYVEVDKLVQPDNLIIFFLSQTKTEQSDTYLIKNLRSHKML